MVSLVQLAADQGATNADWLEAWATVVAAVGTIGAFVWQGRALRQERDTRREEIARLEAAQARTVVLHYLHVGPPEEPDSQLPIPPSPILRVLLGNYGDQPITDVYAEVRWRHNDGRTRGSGIGQGFAVLAGGKTKELQWSTREIKIPEKTAPGRPSGWEPFVYVKFRDVHGVRWELSNQGMDQQLKRLS